MRSAYNTACRGISHSHDYFIKRFYSRYPIGLDNNLIENSGCMVDFCDTRVPAEFHAFRNSVVIFSPESAHLVNSAVIDHRYL